MIRAALVTLALVFSAACSGGDTVSPPSTSTNLPGASATATPTKAPAFTNDQLSSALLTTSDLGGTWKVPPPSTTKATPTPSPSPTPSGDSGCSYFDRLISSGKINVGATDGPTASFAVDTFGPFLSHQVSAPGDAKKAMSSVSGVASNCKTFKSADANGTVTEFQIERIEMKKAGDDTVALRMTGTAPPSILGSIGFEVAMVAVRQGDLTSQIVWFGLNSKPDVAFLQRLADAAAEKMKAVTK